VYQEEKKRKKYNNFSVPSLVLYLSPLGSRKAETLQRLNYIKTLALTG
jgi:hypothetical protein